MTPNSTLQSKLGGSHSTIIGGRHGKKFLKIISDHPDVKRIIPSVITVKGKSAPGGKIDVKLLRPDSRGNLRALLTHGTSSQEVRIVTNVGMEQEGEKIMQELNAMFME
ncbi:DUF2103 domain-containing protein [Methanohalophilus sp.]